MHDIVAILLNDLHGCDTEQAEALAVVHVVTTSIAVQTLTCIQRMVVKEQKIVVPAYSYLVQTIHTHRDLPFGRDLDAFVFGQQRCGFDTGFIEVARQSANHVGQASGLGMRYCF